MSENQHILIQFLRLFSFSFSVWSEGITLDSVWAENWSKGKTCMESLAYFASRFLEVESSAFFTIELESTNNSASIGIIDLVAIYHTFSLYWFFLKIYSFSLHISSITFSSAFSSFYSESLYDIDHTAYSMIYSVSYFFSYSLSWDESLWLER